MMPERGKVRLSTLDRAIVRDSIRLAGLSFEAGILGWLGWLAWMVPCLDLACWYWNDLDRLLVEGDGWKMPFTPA